MRIRNCAFWAAARPTGRPPCLVTHLLMMCSAAGDDDTEGSSRTVVLPTDYRLAQTIGAAAAAAGLVPFGLGLAAALPLGALRPSCSRTRVVRFSSTTRRSNSCGGKRRHARNSGDNSPQVDAIGDTPTLSNGHCIPTRTVQSSLAFARSPRAPTDKATSFRC